MSTEKTLLDEMAKESASLAEILGMEEVTETVDLNQMRAKAESGDQTSIQLLGIKYLLGDGVEKDPIEAMYWLEKSTSAIAKHSMGRYYQQVGEFELAEKYFLEEAADPSNAYQAYNDTGGYFVECTYCSGEQDFLIFDQKQNMKLVDAEYPRGENECLYLVGERGSRVGGFGFIKRLLKDERLLHLYCDWDYLKEHSSEKMSVQYLWDWEERTYPGNSNYKTLVENSAAYHMCEHNLTDALLDIKEENEYSNIRDVFVKDAKIWKNQNVTESINLFDVGEYRYKKKALIVSHKYDGGRKIVAILVPREAADVVVVKGDYVKHPDPSCTEGYVLRVNAIEREEGVCWKYYVGTTIHHSAKTFLKNVPLNLTEEKPEGLPDDLWRYWFRLRYYFNHQKQ